DGEMACGEFGSGRMAEPNEIADAIENVLSIAEVGSLSGVKALVTAGPAQEPFDPLRFIANRSAGQQGCAVAGRLAGVRRGTTLVSGPVEIVPPSRVKLLKVETAREMLAACLSILPVDVAVCTAAVADWRPEIVANSKIKKGDHAPSVKLVSNPDILSTIAHEA